MAKQTITHYLIVWFDAIVFKIRSDGKMTNKACYLAIGLNTEGKKEVLGLWISETESATFWLSVISDIQSRGVEDIVIASIDNLKGLDEAIKSIYPKIIIQVCVIHQIRNSLNYVVWKDKKEFARDLKAVYAAPTREAAEKGLDELEQKWADKYPLIIKSWHRNWEKLSSYYDYPPAIRKIMYTTNTIESLNRVIRKFTKARTIFPNDDSVKKVIYLAVIEIGKKWIKPIPNWQIILSQFAIIFPDRVNIKI